MHVEAHRLGLEGQVRGTLAEVVGRVRDLRAIDFGAREGHDERRDVFVPDLVEVHERSVDFREGFGAATADDEAPGLRVARGWGPACSFEQRGDLFVAQGVLGVVAARAPAVFEELGDRGFGRVARDGDSQQMTFRRKTYAKA